MKGRLRGYDPNKSLLCNVVPASLMTTLTSTAIAVEWEGLLVDANRTDLHLGSTLDVLYILAIFRDM